MKFNFRYSLHEKTESINKMTLLCLFSPVKGTYVAENGKDTVHNCMTFLAERVDGQYISSPFTGTIVAQILKYGYRIGRTCFPDDTGRGLLSIIIANVAATTSIVMEIPFGPRNGSKFLFVFKNERAKVCTGQRLVSFSSYAYVTLYLNKNATIFCRTGDRVKNRKTFIATCNS
jgi:hypothetical protein